MIQRNKDLDRFYRLVSELRMRIGTWTLGNVHGKLAWPRQGVYFFFEPDEIRADGKTPRVVRVGTHAVSKGSSRTLWNRLSAHRGTLKDGGGNHRGSIFRRHVGSAMIARDRVQPPVSDTWGRGSSANKSIRECESPVERDVSAYIRRMPFLWIRAEDEAGPSSIRATLESNAISLLSCSTDQAGMTDPPSAEWLGHHCPAHQVRRSGLWNVRGTDDEYDPAFLDTFARCAAETRAP